MSSDKTIKANRENGQHSTGPTSPEGKARSSCNALKSGIFSKALVVESAGERQEDFDVVLSGLQETFPPQEILSGYLVEDFAGIIWRLQRVRRYEAAEIRKHCATARWRRLLEKTSEVNLLKVRFTLDYAALCFNAPRSAERMAFTLSLAENRRQLERTSGGLDFLLEQMGDIREMVERDGYLSWQAAELLIQVWGMGEDQVGFISVLNQAAKEFKNGERADGTRFEETKQTFLTLLKVKMEDLGRRKDLIISLESAEEEASLAALVMPPAEVMQKIHRVETPLRRDFFKTIDTLLEVTYGISR